MPGGPEDRPWPVIADYESVQELIAPVRDVEFWGIGHDDSVGRFVSLSVWNHHEGMLAFCGASPGACRLGGYVGGDNIRLNAENVFDFAFGRPGVFLFNCKPWFKLESYDVFESEMYRLRDWGEPRYSRTLAEQMLRNALAPAVTRLSAFLMEAK